MKLLLDQNLSPHLAQQLADLFPNSLHVRDVGLHHADDEEIWDYAAANELTIVTRDAHFNNRSYLFGHPPKVVWIRLGNCSTLDMLAALRARHAELVAFEKDPDVALLSLQ